jgi:predicted nucleotidyltransferase
VAASAQTQSLDAERLADRRARAAIDALWRLGVTAEIIGSLTNQSFDQPSDVDLLVKDYPRWLNTASRASWKTACLLLVRCPLS